MKIAMIGQKGIPATFGGVERHVQELALRLVRLGQEVTVFCRPYYTRPGIEAGLAEGGGGRYTLEGVELRLLPTINSKHLDAITHSFLSSLAVLGKGFDIVHYHAIGPSMLTFLPRLLSKAGVVATVHGLDWQRAKWSGPAVWFLKLGESATAHVTHGTIVVSKTLREYYREKHGAECFYIPNGLHLPELLPPSLIREKHGLRGGDYFLFVGRLVPEKGCHYLIEAFKGLKTDKKLVIAGGSSHSGAYEEELHRLAREDARVVFTGYVYGDELNELYSNCYLFVLPSELEGLPIALLEALGYACPALVSHIPENLEVVAPEGGMLYGFGFENKNVDDLRNKMEQSLAAPERLAALKSGLREYIGRNYDWDRIALDTLRVYEKVLRVP